MGKLFYLEEWNVGLAERPARLESSAIGPIRWRPMSGRTSFVADPFLFLDGPESRVLMEEFDYWTGRGLIRSCSVHGLLGPESLQDEIARPHHLSYPFVFQADDRWYCVPESSESRSVDLHVWDPVARAWHHKSRLIQNARIYDPTLLTHEGHWYLFGTLVDDAPHSKLRLWWSGSLAGPWRAHPRDPVRTATDQVRSAGAIFSVDGRWYRPSQDCRGGYGRAVILNRIDVISPSDYSETPVHEWRPAPDSEFPEGMHTISLGPTFVVVDGKRSRFSPLAPVWKSWWRLRAALR